MEFTERWISPISALRNDTQASLNFTDYQDTLFDDYISKFDDCIENALTRLAIFDNEVQLNHANKAADNVKSVLDIFIADVRSIVRAIIKQISGNQELLVIFYVLYNIYGQMQEDHDHPLSNYNPLFYKVLHDFKEIYLETLREELPLPEQLNKMLM